MILTPGIINRPNRSTPIGPNHTVPYGTVLVFAHIPGTEVPGYHHSVPPGRLKFRYLMDPAREISARV